MPNEFLDEIWLSENEQENNEPKKVAPEEEEEEEEIPVILPGLGGGDDLRVTYVPTKRPSKERQRIDEQLLSTEGFSNENLNKLSPTQKSLLATYSYIYDTNFFVPERQGLKKIWHTISSLWADDEPLTASQVKTNCENEGFSDEDYENFFSNITSRRDFEYTKDALKKERAIRSYLSSPKLEASDSSSGFDLIHFLSDALEIFSYAGIAKKGIVKLGTSFPEAMSKATQIASHIPIIDNKILRNVVSNAFIASGLSFRDYASKYEMTAQEALVNASIGTAIGATFPVLGAGIKSVYQKCFDARKISKQVEEVMDNAYEEYKRELGKLESKKQNSAVDKVEKFLSTKMPLLKDPVSILNFNTYSPTARKFVKRLATMGGENVICCENEAILASGKLFQTFHDVLQIGKKDQRYIEETTGKTLNEWIDLHIRGVDLPKNIPHRETIQSAVNSLMKFRKECVAEARALGVPDVQNQLGGDFLNKELATKANLSFEDLLYTYEANTAEIADVYVPRVYDIKKIQENPEEFKKILLNSFKKEKFKELHYGEKYKDLSYEQKKELFNASEQQLKKDVQDSYNKLVWSDIEEQLVTDPTTLYPSAMRDIRVTDMALLPFLKGGAFQHIITDTTSLIRKKEIYKLLGEFNIQTPDELKEVIRNECIDALEKTGTKNNKALKDISKSVDSLLHYFLGKPSALSEVKFNNIANSFNNYSYAALLGMTAINSLTDISPLVARFGLKGLFNAVVNDMPKIIKEMKGDLTKEQLEKMLQVLPDGLIENSRSYLAKISGAFENDNINLEVFSNKYANSFVKFGKRASDGIFKWSGLKYWDGGLAHTAKKAFVRELLDNPEVVNLTKEELENQIATGQFSMDVERYVLKQIQQTLIRPTLKDKPLVTYNTYFKPFFVFCSWANAYKNNYLFPLLKGDFGFQRTAESLGSLLISSAVVVGLKDLVTGNLDLTSDEKKKDFQNKVYRKVFDELAGNFYCGIATYLGRGINSIIQYNNWRKSGVDIITNQAPSVSYWSRMLGNFISGSALLSRDIYAGGNIKRGTKNTWSRFAKGISNHPAYQLFYREFLETDDLKSKRQKQKF